MAAGFFFIIIIISPTEISTLSKSASRVQTLASISCYLFHFVWLLRWLHISVVPYLSHYICSQEDDAPWTDS